jgi:hypothetical protein
VEKGLAMSLSGGQKDWAAAKKKVGNRQNNEYEDLDQYQDMKCFASGLFSYVM